MNDLLKITESENLNLCPCGIGTDRVLLWEFNDFKHEQPLCRTCEKDLRKVLKESN